MPSSSVPTLAEWAGGLPALERLTEIFYATVKRDPLLAPVFASMGPDHPKHVAGFVAEVLGGPKAWSAVHGEPGGHAAMVTRHFGRKLTEVQRRRCVDLMLNAADQAALPVDPEFRHSPRRRA